MGCFTFLLCCFKIQRACSILIAYEFQFSCSVFVRNSWSVFRFCNVHCWKSEFPHLSCSKHAEKFSSNWTVHTSHFPLVSRPIDKTGPALFQAISLCRKRVSVFKQSMCCEPPSSGLRAPSARAAARKLEGKQLQADPSQQSTLQFLWVFFFFDNLCKLLRGAASHNENLLRIDSRRENVKSLLLTLIIID